MLELRSPYVENIGVTLPERLGRLRRVDRIGAGGFATVWLYHDDELDSPVAVKALAENWAQRTDIRDRFLEEARMLRRADSDHVVRVYDIGEIDQTPYFVMSYADRGSLATLSGRTNPPSQVVNLLLQACEGVRVLHQRGIIHRDIKPENLLLRADDDGSDQVLVADLGVAKAMLHASGLTQVVGTPAYMAPEQALGLGVDSRADVHALGAVAYRLMTGHYARSGGVAELTAATRPAPPSSLVPELAAYDTVLLRALEPRAEDRWPDAVSFASALKRASAGDQITIASEPSRTLDEPFVVPVRRHKRPLVLFGSAAGVLAIVVGAVLGMPSLLSHNTPRRTPPTTTPSAPPTAPPKITIAPDVAYPALGAVTLSVRHQIVSASGAVWSYEVPAGWVATDPNTDKLLHGGQINKQHSITWRPPHPPHLGGYSLRFDALNSVMTPQDMRAQLVNELQSPTTNDVHEFKILANRPDNGLWFTYVDGLSHLRYNFFRWLSQPSGAAGLQVAVVGRKVDAIGLENLLNQIVMTAYPAS